MTISITEHVSQIFRAIVGICCAALLALYPVWTDAAPDNTESGNTSQQSIIHAYIVAHPDDWQLFMGDVAFAQIADGQRVVFIYLTSGGANRPPAYWQARERGAAASVHVAIKKVDTLETQPIMKCHQITIRLHPLLRCDDENTSSYFLRLPDGNMGGSGFSQYHRQSLSKLFSGQPIAATDGSADYPTLVALQDTILALLESEMKVMPLATLELHTHDPALASNQHDHADHWATGTIAAQIAAKLNVDTFYYAGYGITALPVNLSASATKMKEMLFAAYDRQPVSVNPAWSASVEWPSAYSAWLSRTYRRAESRQPISKN